MSIETQRLIKNFLLQFQQNFIGRQTVIMIVLIAHMEAEGKLQII